MINTSQKENLRETLREREHESEREPETDWDRERTWDREKSLLETPRTGSEVVLNFQIIIFWLGAQMWESVRFFFYFLIRNFIFNNNSIQNKTIRVLFKLKFLFSSPLYPLVPYN